MTSTGMTSTDITRTAAAPTRFDSAALVDLAEVVDRDGLDAHAATLFALAERASQVGVSPVLVDVMLGAGEPSVARLRAFARVGSAVANPRRTRTTTRVAGTLVAA